MSFGCDIRTCPRVHLAMVRLRLATALFFRECRGARLGGDTTDDSLETVRHFLITPKGHRCDVALGEER